MSAQTVSPELAALCESVVSKAADSRIGLASLTGSQRTSLLNEIADAIDSSAGVIERANAEDLAHADDLPEAMRDRLKLDGKRIGAMSDAVRSIAEQIDPVGKVVDGRVLPNGIRVEKRRVPIGVILVIYESRPNVTSDAAALCLKAGNAVLLKGGREAAHSNRAIVGVIESVLAKHNLSGAVGFVDTTDRAALPLLLAMRGKIDLAIPRGGPGLMKAVTDVAKIPVVKHDAGNCHVYIDAHLDGMRQTAIDIAMNAKTQRPGVCNAAETLLVHREAADDMLPELGKRLIDAGVEIRGDEITRRLISGATEATEEDWATEYLELILAVRVVDSLESACEHIRKYGSSHTEAIVTSSIDAAQRFLQQVDSANVMLNCSTRFADGGEYGLGAEIGISTDKLHARGPMGAEDLTTYQWVLTGTGQIRS